MLDITSIFLNLLRLTLWPSMWLILRLTLMRVMYIWLLLNGMLYKYQLSSSTLICHLRPISLWFSVWMICLLMKAVLSPPLWLCYCQFLPLWLLVFALHIEVPPILDAYIFTIVISPFCIDPLIIREAIGNPLQYSCLENPRDGGAWWAAVYGVRQSRTQLKWLSSSSSSLIIM